MLRNLVAIVVLLLALSPFTAPFQTCDAGRAVVAVPVDHDDNPGSLVAPLLLKASDAAVVLVALLINPFTVSSKPLTRLHHPQSKFLQQLARPAVLRV